jgi:2-methylcitrate synthase
MSKNKETKPSGGLAGVVAGESAIATVGIEGAGLNYRGYPIEQLAKSSTFEEVAYLLLKGHLPSSAELLEFNKFICAGRKLPEGLVKILEAIPVYAHPMDVMRTISSAMGLYEPEKEDMSNQIDCSIRLISVFGPALLYWYHFSNSGIRIKTETAADDSVAANFVKLLQLKDDVDNTIVKAVDVSLILYAEHDFAASTFASRITASTLADIHSAITSGIATLKGKLHGGANEAAMLFVKDIKSIEQADAVLKSMFAKKELIMGFGHRVYKKGDPRHALIKEWSKELSNKPYGDKVLYEMSDYIEQQMLKQKGMHCNLDFFAASTYAQCGIPTYLFTPIFVISRTTGWAGHVFEQRANNKLIRPSSLYVGPPTRSYVEINNRPKL